MEIPPETVKAFRWNYDRKRITAAFCHNLKNKELLLWFTVVLPCSDNFPVFQLPLFLKMHVCRVALRFLHRLLRGPHDPAWHQQCQASMRRDATVFEKTNVQEEQLKFSLWGADSAESIVRFSLSRSEVRKGPTKGTACCRECAGPPGFDSILFTLPPTFNPHTLPGNWFLYLIWCSASFHVKSNSANFLKGKGRLWRDTGTEHLPAVSLKRYRSSLFVTSDSHCARILDWIFAIINW